MERLAGKVAIITGGAKGIGAATARRFVLERASVVVADIDLAAAETLAAELGAGAIAIAVDAADAASIENMVSRTVSHFGKLDILHNNAAYRNPSRQRLDTTAPDTPLDVWQEILNVNLTGYMLGCKYAIPQMLKSGGGAIINTASDAGLAGDIERIAYGVSKAGAIALSKYVATQHGREGIRCNAVAPGLVLTPGLRAVVPELIDVISHHVLINRLGLPEDIAALVAFLASDDAAYITGQVICCDGGHLAHQPQTAEVTALYGAKNTAGRNIT